MSKKSVDMIIQYKKLIEDEYYEHIIEEMLVDLKAMLLEEASYIDENILILETFYNISHTFEINSELDKLIEFYVITEDVEVDTSKAISNMKAGFTKKHEKILKRDKAWLKKSSKKILELNFEEIELEVLSDYKVTFEQLLNRHNIFDKLFVNSENNLSEKLRRFEDKHENLKNGLDNYFRTGTSRREIGLRKVSGPEAKTAVENMIAYCESFLAGRQFLEEKLNSIIIAINDSKVKENYSPIEILREAIEEGKKEKEIIKEEKKEKEPVESEEDVNIEEEPVEEEPEEDSTAPERGIEDRRVGIAVLLTVAEERYFDYINILKGLEE